MTRHQSVLYGAAFAICMAASVATESLADAGLPGILALVAVMVLAGALVYAAERRWFER